LYCTPLNTLVNKKNVEGFNRTSVALNIAEREGGEKEMLRVASEILKTI